MDPNWCKISSIYGTLLPTVLDCTKRALGQVCASNHNPHTVAYLEGFGFQRVVLTFNIDPGNLAPPMAPNLVEFSGVFGCSVLQAVLSHCRLL